MQQQTRRGRCLYERKRHHGGRPHSCAPWWDFHEDAAAGHVCVPNCPIVGQTLRWEQTDGWTGRDSGGRGGQWKGMEASTRCAWESASQGGLIKDNVQTVTSPGRDLLPNWLRQTFSLKYINKNTMLRLDESLDALLIVGDHNNLLTHRHTLTNTLATRQEPTQLKFNIQCRSSIRTSH